MYHADQSLGRQYNRNPTTSPTHDGLATFSTPNYCTQTVIQKEICTNPAPGLWGHKLGHLGMTTPPFVTRVKARIHMALHMAQEVKASPKYASDSDALSTHRGQVTVGDNISPFISFWPCASVKTQAAMAWYSPIVDRDAVTASRRRFLSPMCATRI